MDGKGCGARFRAQLAVFALGAVPLAAFAGEGFYLGAEGGVSLIEDQTFKIYGDSSLLPAADGSVISEASFDTGYIAGLVAGYSFLGGLRSELELDYRRNDIDDATRGDGLLGGDSEVDGYEHVDTAMFNLWLDFNKSGTVHPYIGAGAGAARIEFRNATFSGFELSDEKDTVFAFQGGTGVGFDFGDHVTMSLDYRYLRSDRGTFNFIADQPFTEVKARYESHAVMLGLRYSFRDPPAPVPPAPEPPVQVVEAPPPPPPPLPPCTPPAEGMPMSLEGCKVGDVLVLRGVNFLFDQDSLTVNAKVLLDMVGDALLTRTDITVELAGYTDSKGSDAYNQSLSERRATSVMDYLLSRKVEAGRMSAKGFGETSPVADNETDDGRELNRRVELRVTGSRDGLPVPVESTVVPAETIVPATVTTPEGVVVPPPQP